MSHGSEVLSAVLLGESVAGLHFSGIETSLNPVVTLGRGAVRNSIRVHGTGLGAMPTIVTHSRRTQRGFDIVPCQASVLSGTGPNSGETVCLKLQTDGERIYRRCRALLHLPHPGFNDKDLLNVVADLVCDDIRLRELASGPEAIPQFLEEAEVEVTPSRLRDTFLRGQHLIPGSLYVIERVQTKFTSGASRSSLAVSTGPRATGADEVPEKRKGRRARRQTSEEPAPPAAIRRP